MHPSESTQANLFTERGFGGEMGFGEKSALIVVDLQRGFTDPDLPLGSDQDREVRVVRELLDAYRESGDPVVFLAIRYCEEGAADAGVWIRKNKGVTSMAEGSRATELDPRLGRAASEPVLYRQYPSGFFGTDLASRLTLRKVDTTVIVGCTTSGCVRATAVDALSYGLRPIVVHDAVADRSAEAHRQSLVDIETKYGDVVSAADVIGHVTNSPTRNLDNSITNREEDGE